MTGTKGKRAFPPIPSQADLDLRQTLRARKETGRAAILAGVADALRTLPTARVLSRTITVSPPFAPDAGDDAPEDRIDAYRKTLNDLGIGDGGKQSVRFPYKG